ncbi:MAG: hypothetical protein ACPL4K_06825, partial [Candidatus Margulisiibacteriota bacterium]
RIPASLLKERFAQIIKAEGGKIQEEALDIVVQAASGSFRDGEAILEQLLTYAEGEITVNDVRELLGLTEDEWLEKLIVALFEGNYKEIFEIIDNLTSLGRDPRNVSRDIIQYLRQLLAVSVGSSPGVWKERAERLKSLSCQISTPFIIFLLEPLASLEWQMRSAVEPRYLLEMSLMLASSRLQEKTPKLVPPVTTATIVQPQEKSEIKEAAEEKALKVGVDSQILAEEKELPAAKQPPATPEEINLEKLKERWPSILERVKKKSVPTYILASKGTLSDFREGQILLTFDRAFSFHKNMVEKSENRLLIEVSIEEILGRKYPIKCLLGNGETGEKAEEIKS